MIDNINKMPLCTMQSVWSFFKPLELIKLRGTCKSFKESIEACWTPNFGVSIERLLTILQWTQSDTLKSLITDDLLDLRKIDEINRVLKFSFYHPRQNLINELFDLKEASDISKNHSNCLCFLTSDCAIIAIKSELITQKYIMKIVSSNINYLIPILSHNGIIALKKKLITLDQMASIPNIGHLIHLLSDNGIEALENGKLTIENAIKLPIEDLYDIVRDHSCISHEL